MFEDESDVGNGTSKAVLEGPRALVSGQAVHSIKCCAQDRPPC